MDMSFYVGALGAANCTEKLSVISNNLANVNNTGFKPKTTVFSELINYNLNDSPDAVTELQAGAGMRVERTYTGFDVAPVVQTESMTMPSCSPMRSSCCGIRRQTRSRIPATGISTARRWRMAFIS